MAQDAGNTRLAAYKGRAAPDPAQAAIPIKRKERVLGHLLAALAPLAAADLENLASWRNAHRTAFFSERMATAASTARWLESIARTPDRILFLVATTSGEVVGHIGLNHVDESARTAESDAWLGVGHESAPGLMLGAFASLIDWAFTHLGATTLAARVFGDNLNVIRAHRMLGFTVEESHNYVRHEDAQGASWSPGEGAVTRPVATLLLQRDRFVPQAGLR